MKYLILLFTSTHAVIRSEYETSSEGWYRIMSWKRNRWKWSWNDLRCYTNKERNPFKQ